MTVGDAIASLRKEIQDRAKALSVLEEMVANSGPESPAPMIQGRRRRKGGPPQSVGAHAVDVLHTAGKPMHALREILPALLARGLKVSKQSLPTTLGRQKELRRTARGTWAYAGGHK
jgi:hypothetical protein